MTWLLITVALIWCPTFIGLRLHASWTPPEPPPPLTPLSASVQHLIEGTRRAMEGVSRCGVSMQQIAEAMAARDNAAMASASRAFAQLGPPFSPDAYRWTPDMETP